MVAIEASEEGTELVLCVFDEGGELLRDEISDAMELLLSRPNTPL